MMNHLYFNKMRAEVSGHIGSISTNPRKSLLKFPTCGKRIKTLLDKLPSARGQTAIRAGKMALEIPRPAQSIHISPGGNSPVKTWDEIAQEI